MPLTIEGIQSLNAKLGSLAAKHGTGKPAVAVGFTANYALYVHENMEIWPPGMRLKGLPRGQGFSRKGGVVYVPKRVLSSGQVGGKHRGFFWDPQGKAGPKFLEGPARELATELGKIVAEALLTGQTMAQGLLKAGLRLQREAQQRVPVDTGNLKASAFTRLEMTEFSASDARSELGLPPEGG